MTALTFREFQTLNRRRCEDRSGFGHSVAYDDQEWPLQNWGLAISGEVGEFANLLKKCLRGDFTIEEKRAELLKELADVITYCDLATSSLGADTDDVLMAKFDEVSARIGWTP